MNEIMNSDASESTKYWTVKEPKMGVSQVRSDTDDDGLLGRTVVLLCVMQ